MKEFLRETNDFFAGYMAPVTRKIFYANVLVFLFMFLVFLLAGNSFLTSLVDRIFILRPSQAVFQGHIWQFFTYMFAHGDAFHLLMNMLVLFFFGSLVENQLGSQRFFWFVILSGFAGAVAHTVYFLIAGAPQMGLLGFSGATFAILMAAAIWFPRTKVLFMFLIPVPLRLLVAIIGFFTFVGLLGASGNGVSHLAHAAGFLMGFFFVKLPFTLNFFARLRFPWQRRRARVVPLSMGHPGRHSDPDDRYDDPHWRLDQ